MTTCNRSIIFVMIFILWSIPCVYSRELLKAAPESAGMSSDRLNRINKVMQQHVDDRQIAGVVTLVARKGKIVHHESFGMMDIGEGKTMSGDALFRIASMSKPITSTAVMILYEEGRFLLSEPVSKFIPEFKNPQVLMPSQSGDSYTLEPAKREITIRHLLNHTSGITYGEGLHKNFYDKAGITSGLAPTEGAIGEMIKKLAGLPLISHPGEEMHYGLSIDVLGYLIEVVSGMDIR